MSAACFPAIVPEVTLRLPACVLCLLPAAGVLALLAACSSFPGGSNGPVAEAPQYRVDDRWVYDVQDGFFRTAVHWRETWEVTAIGPEGIRARVTQRGPSGEYVRNELWPAPGLVKVGAVFDNETRRFSTPLIRYDFPLVPGKVWNQRIDQYDESMQRQGEISHDVRVRDWSQVSTAAGNFEAISLRISMWLNDGEFWRYPTSCSYLLQYSPSVRGMVHEEKEAQYIERNDGNTAATFRSQHAVYDLVSFTPGKP